MAHNIHFNEQKKTHSFFSVHQKPWHGLGKIVEQYPTSAEAIEWAGLDYQVEKRKLFTLDRENCFGNADTLTASLPLSNHFATVRTDNDTVLGVVGKDYKVVQNRDAFSFFDAIVEGDGILYETAGALGMGERIFITAKLPHYIRVGSDDLIEKYLFLTTSHDGTGSITAAFTPVRVVCQNTLSAALKNCSNRILIRHTANARERLAQGHKIMGITNRLSEELEGIFNQWARVPMGDKETKALIQKALSTDRNESTEKEPERPSAQLEKELEKAYAFAFQNPTQLNSTTKGTLFGSYNAVTGYLQHIRSYKNEEAKLSSLMMGGTAQRKTQKAFDLCAAFARHGADCLKV